MKYIKLKSLTWWCSFAALIAGAVVAMEPVHGMTGMATAINNLTGNMPASQLVLFGLTGIGLRGAIA